MKTSIKNIFFILFMCTLLDVNAATTNVNCTSGSPGVLSLAVTTAVPGTIINVSGTCHESIVITTDDLTLVGNSGGSKAIISGFFPADRITVNGAARLAITGFIIENGVFGLSATNNASLSVKDTEIRNNVIGADITNGSMATFSGEVTISGSHAFGLEVLTGSKLVIEENAILNIVTNFLGSQIAVNSTLFVSTGAQVNALNNTTLGLSINTGSTGMLFNAKLHTDGNGLDGLDVVSSGNFEVDGESSVVSENNGRDGISIDNSTLNLFGFFSTIKGFPNVVAHNNMGNGILVESTSKLDVGRNASITAHHNGIAGIRLDDGSSALIQRSDVHSNNGFLPRNDAHEEDDDKNNDRPADIVVTFGSRISFNQNKDNAGDIEPNIVGLALCDKSSLSRGDVRCKH